VLVTVVSGGKEVDDKNVERVVDVELVEVGKSDDSEVFLLDIDVLVLDGLCMHVDCVCVIGVCAVFY
jgi:hypothetical protein